MGIDGDSVNVTARDWWTLRRRVRLFQVLFWLYLPSAAVTHLVAGLALRPTLTLLPTVVVALIQLVLMAAAWIWLVRWKCSCCGARLLSVSMVICLPLLARLPQACPNCGTAT